MKKDKNTGMAIKVSLITIIINGFLSAIKLAAGLLSNSGAMVSDAVHSASDVFTTLIVMAGVKISAKESDKDHQYGHERLECAAAIILAVILGATGIGIGYAGVKKIIYGGAHELLPPGALALVAAFISIGVKEWMFWYTRSAAKKINSGALMADAWHHRSDAMSSVGSLVGILGARHGLPVLDPLASVIICVFIVKAAFDIFVDSIDKMTDRACDESITAEIESIIMEQEGVLGIDQLMTRIFGDKIYVDIEICADGEKTLNETHDIAQKIHDCVENRIPNVKHCMVHVNPKNNK